MRNVVITGRVIPERALVQFPATAFEFQTLDTRGKGKLCCQMSLFSCVLEFEKDVNNIFLVSSIAKDVVSDFSNIISFHISGAYHIALDLVIDVETGENHPIPTREPVFPSDRKHISFVPLNDHDPVKIEKKHLENAPLKEALSELSLALQRPHLTQMHCRRALEAVRWSFEQGSEKDEKKREAAGWERLRESLGVERKDIETFKEMALNQRHGRRTDNNWEARKEALQNTFEVVHRYMQYLLK